MAQISVLFACEPGPLAGARTGRLDVAAKITFRLAAASPASRAAVAARSRC